MTTEPIPAVDGKVTRGWFEDGAGRVWFCRENRERVVVCDTLDGWFTAANLATFARWGWQRTSDPRTP